MYLVEGIVLKDRKVAFNDLNDENGEEIGVGVEDAAFESKGKSDKKIAATMDGYFLISCMLGMSLF